MNKAQKSLTYGHPVFLIAMGASAVLLWLLLDISMWVYQAIVLAGLVGLWAAMGVSGWTMGAVLVASQLWKQTAVLGLADWQANGSLPMLVFVFVWICAGLVAYGRLLLASGVAEEGK